MQLPLFLLDLASKLLNKLFKLKDKAFLPAPVLLKALPLALMDLVEALSLAAVLVRFILRLTKLVFKVFESASHITLPRLHLRLVDLRLLCHFLLLSCLRLLDLPHKLFLL